MKKTSRRTATSEERIDWMARTYCTCPDEETKDTLLEHWVRTGADPFKREHDYKGPKEGYLAYAKAELKRRLEQRWEEMQKRSR